MRLREMKTMFPVLPSKSGKIDTSGLAAAPLKYGRKLGRPVGDAVKKGATFDSKKKVVSTARCDADE